jgi:hypothetical protein
MTTQARRTAAKSADGADPTVTAPDADATGAPAEDATKAAEKSAEKGDGDTETKSGTRYLNTTNGPLVYDAEGHMVDGGAWIEVSALDAVGRGLREHGYLLPPSAL